MTHRIGALRTSRPLIVVGIAAAILFTLPSPTLEKGGDQTTHTRLPAVAEYCWPTSASERVTSSFAEYRTSHFHGGIDISTNGQTGYPVYAVRDGFVSRIRITPNGYGKMLYVRHGDGSYSTYAHLQGFNAPITALVRTEQYRRETYEIDLRLDSAAIRVAKGEVIAYTGDTGFGPPHLHFELRDENLNPINPMLDSHFGGRDNIAPTVRRMMISPLGYGSTVENGSSARYVSRFPRRQGRWIIPGAIRIHGDVGLGIDVIDRSDGSWSKTGIHRIELLLRDSLTFAAQLDRVPHKITKQIALHYDYPSILAGRGKYQKLYVDQGNSLPFYDGRSPGSGIIRSSDWPEGELPFTIACIDVHGNRSELSGRFIINDRPQIVLRGIEDGQLTIGADKPDNIHTCYVYGKRHAESGWTQHTLTHGRFIPVPGGLQLPVSLGRYDVVKIIASTKGNSLSDPIFYTINRPSGPIRHVSVEYNLFNEYVRVAVSTQGVFSAAPACSLIEGSSRRSVILRARDLNSYEGAIVPLATFAGERMIRVVSEIGGNIIRSAESFELYSIPPTEAGGFSLRNGSLTVTYDSGSVFTPLHMRIRSDETKRSALYILEPQDVLLNGGITVTLPYDGDIIADRAGIYVRTTGGWVFQTCDPDSGGRTLSAFLDKTLGDVAVLRDQESPSFGRLRVLPRGGRVFVGFRYHDNLSGVDTDEIKMYINDQLVIPEIDGEHRGVRYEAENRLARGQHTVRITMKDRARNTAEIERRFKVR